MIPKPKPIFKKHKFWDVNFEKLDNDLRANLVIERVFERGDVETISVELLQHYSLQQVAGWHKQKYPGQMLALSIPHEITCFVYADESETPVSFKNQTWVDVKKGISKAVRDYLI